MSLLKCDVEDLELLEMFSGCARLTKEFRALPANSYMYARSLPDQKFAKEPAGCDRSLPQI